MRLVLPVLVCFSFALSEPALAEDGWAEKPAGLTNADVLDLYSNILTARINAEMADPRTGTQAQVILLDRDGKTHLQMLIPEAAIAEVQKMAPGQQTAEMLKMHQGLVKAVRESGEQKIDLFDSVSAYPTAASRQLAEFMRSRTDADWVVTIGFKKGGKHHIYASVSGGRVDFNPEAPVASK
ncbi:MAG: hypothetical protein ACOZNI_16265 [Myxococcota bacterium]